MKYSHFGLYSVFVSSKGVCLQTWKIPIIYVLVKKQLPGLEAIYETWTELILMTFYCWSTWYPSPLYIHCRFSWLGKPLPRGVIIIYGRGGGEDLGKYKMMRLSSSRAPQFLSNTPPPIRHVHLSTLHFKCELDLLIWVIMAIEVAFINYFWHIYYLQDKEILIFNL